MNWFKFFKKKEKKDYAEIKCPLCGEIEKMSFTNPDFNPSIKQLAEKELRFWLRDHIRFCHNN